MVNQSFFKIAHFNLIEKKTNGPILGVISLFYLFKTEVEVFIRKDNFEELFDCKTGNHPEILKKYLQKGISIETITILDLILEFTKNFDKKLTDPVWEFVSLRIQKYKGFINIDVDKYKQTLREIVL